MRGFWLIIPFISFSILASAQINFTITGEIMGVARDRVFLKDVEEDVVSVTQMVSGKFHMNVTKAKSGIYSIEFSNGAIIQFYACGENLKVSGYIDISSPNKNDLIVLGSATNDKYNSYIRTIVDERKRYSKHISEKITSATTDKELNDWITKLNNSHNYITGYSKNIVENEQNYELAAAVAYTTKGPYYENSELLYNALCENGKKSMCGVALNNSMKSILKFANGQVAPHFTLVDNRGKEMKLSDFKGKTIVLDFWASWCGPCRKEMYSLKAIYEAFKSPDLVFISISLDDVEEKWLAAEDEEQIPWVSLWDKEGFSSSRLRKEYNFSSIPFIIVIDKEGNLAGKNLRRNNLRDKLNELLK